MKETLSNGVFLLSSILAPCKWIELPQEDTRMNLRISRDAARMSQLPARSRVKLTPRCAIPSTTQLVMLPWTLSISLEITKSSTDGSELPGKLQPKTVTEKRSDA
jgi:hypothetical protein